MGLAKGFNQAPNLGIGAGLVGLVVGQGIAPAIAGDQGHGAHRPAKLPQPGHPAPHAGTQPGRLFLGHAQFFLKGHQHRLAAIVPFGKIRLGCFPFCHRQILSQL